MLGPQDSEMRKKVLFPGEAHGTAEEADEQQQQKGLQYSGISKTAGGR